MTPTLGSAARNSILCAAIALLAPAAALAGWGASGIPATRAAGAQAKPVAVSDGAGGMFVGWADPRSGYNTDIYVQRILPVGSIGAQWTPDGNALTHVTCTKYDLAMTADGAGGAIAVWADVRCPGSGIARLYAQRVRGDGSCDPAWPGNGRALCSSLALQEKPAVTSDGAGGAFVAWCDRRSGSMAPYATRVTSAGVIAPGWPDSGRKVWQVVREGSGPVVAADGVGGCYVAWTSPGTASDTIRVLRYAADGSFAAGWSDGGVVACGMGGHRGDVRISAASDGGVWVAWVDTRDGSSDVYASRIDGAGVRTAGWPAAGLAIATGGANQAEPALAERATGHVVLAWSDDSGGSGADVRAVSLDVSGALSSGWTAGGAEVCSAPGNQLGPLVVADGEGGALFAWTDARDSLATGRDIYGQRLSSDGSRAPGWVVDGHPICLVGADQSAPALVAGGDGGALAAWLDARNLAQNNLDVYANRIGADGPLPTQVRDLAAVHHDGQTFLTATAPASTGYTYRFYASDSPITSAADLANATFVGSPMDSSWHMRRLSEFMGRTYTYRIDSLATPLDSSQVLFVRTPTVPGAVYYAATARPIDGDEDVSITPNENALTVPVQEYVSRPRPVFQRQLRVHDQPTDMYTLWTAAEDTPDFPAMCNRPSVPFDCAVRRGYASVDSTSLLVRPATRNLYCLNVIWWTPGYWLMSFDDLLPSVQGSFYFGYHENFDLTLAYQPPPVGGMVRDYTRARCVFLLDWARRTLPVDTTRVYTFGYSLAGAAAATLAFSAPKWIAGTESVSGHYDYSYRDEPVANSGFNTGQYYETLMSELWGPLSLNLPTNSGLRVYEATDASFLAGHMEPVAVPPLISFDGKRDVPMGWAEKVNFYRAMQRHRQGGTFFWDMHEHNTDNSQMWWLPMIGPSGLWRWNSHMSFPALSNCSADDDPGDGDPAHGDSLGTINGHVQWDSLLTDVPSGWAVTLRPRDLTTSFGPRPAPDSFTVDVTPRRLRAFHVTPGQSVPWRVLRVDDDAIVQSGVVVGDSLGRVTVEGVRVHRGGSLLTIGDVVLLDAGPAPRPRLRTPSLSLARNPLRGAGEARVAWPADGDARIELLDVSGRRVHTLWRGVAVVGAARHAIPAGALRAGLYWVVASQGDARVTKRLVVLE